MKNQLKQLTILLLCLLQFTWSHAQEVNALNYGLNEGLPSLETYFTYADKNGYIWVGTDAGLCKYDGYSFTVFTSDNSPLTDNTVFKPYEAPNGEIWFNCYNGTITIYNPETQQLRPFEHNKLIGKERFWVVSITFDASHAYIHHRFGGEFYHQYTFEDSSCVKKEIRTKDLKQVGMADNGSTFFAHKINKNVYVQLVGNGIPSNLDIHPMNYVYCDEGSTYFFLNDFVYASNGDSLTFQKSVGTNVETIHVFEDMLYVPTNSGVMLLKGDSSECILPGEYITFMDVDLEGNIWMSSLKKGIYKVASLYIKSVLKSDSLDVQAVSSMKWFDNKLFLGMDYEAVYVHDESGLKLIVDQIDNQDFKLDVKSFYTDRSRLLIPGLMLKKRETGKYVKQAYDGGKIAKYNDWAQIAAFNLPISQDRIFCCGSYTGYAVQDLNKQHVDQYYEKTDKYRLFSPCLDSSGNIWAGSLVGLWRITVNQLDQPVRMNESAALRQRIDKVLYASGTKILSTRVNGLVFYRQTTVDSVQERHGLISNRINDICLQSDSILWVATNKGLTQIWFNDTGQSVLVNLNTDDGLPSSYIQNLTISGDELYLSTPEGISVLQTDMYTVSKTPPKIYIIDVDVARNPELKIEDKVFRYDQNNITIKYLGLTSKKPEQNFYAYRLTHRLGSEDELKFIGTDITSVNFLDLNHGTYLFEVRCRNKNNIWSETASYEFTIKPHYTDTLWFSILGYGLLALLIVGLVNWRIKEIRSRNDKENQLRDLELKFKESELAILRNQMNPHFMFNALNSIQSYILQSDRDTASHYVQRFSKLMRSSLELSMDDWISLAVEIDFLTNYLTMEQMRFPDRFGFDISVDEQIDPHDIVLPPFLIQPIIENAVKHAFSNLETGGEISVTYELSEGDLICRVEDNGVGINQGKQNRPKDNHKSYGIQVVRNRLRLILNDEDAEPLLFTDISTTTNNQTGTKVEIRIPIE